MHCCRSPHSFFRFVPFAARIAIRRNNCSLVIRCRRARPRLITHCSRVSPLCTFFVSAFVSTLVIARAYSVKHHSEHLVCVRVGWRNRGKVAAQLERRCASSPTKLLDRGFFTCPCGIRYISWGNKFLVAGFYPMGRLPKFCASLAARAAPAELWLRHLPEKAFPGI